MTTAVTASFRRLPRHADDVWQGGLVRMPTWLEEPDGTLERPWGAVWVSLATGMVNLELMPARDAPDWDVALRAFLGLGTGFMKCRPAGLEVNDKGLGDFLVSALGDAELSVTVRHDLPAVRDVLRTMARQVDPRPPVPDALEAPEMTIARLRAFAGAARAFHEAAPWRYLSDADLIRVEAPGVAFGLGWLTVLGGAGHTYGLGFFDSEAAFEALQRDPDPKAILESGAQWSVLFGEPSMLPFAELDLWEEHRLPLAGEAAYPMALRFSATGDHRRPGAAELADIEAILLALARTTQEQVDGGRWRHEVSTHDGPRAVTLAVPDLLVPLDAPLPRRGGAADRRAAERVLLEVQRFTAGSRFESLEDANAAIQQRFEGFLDDIPSTASTPLERAQDLAYRAFEARGRRRALVAR